ncbi:MAG: hypothetical protein AUH30_13725 [Candidatus Rokubacteria bacterium 13_1_40CM_68_15]|nr:MAG: hypothetical protein AUH30_13725 [Candidatus Rokubacteria bacterium 13_1_40CM_68_15]
MTRRVAALAWLGASGLYLAGAATFPFGSGARPGAGFFPVAVGVLLCLVCALFAVHTFRQASEDGRSGGTMPADDRARVLATVAGLIAFCLILPYAGYPLAAAVFVAWLLRRLGGGRWVVTAVIAVVSALVSYYVFAVLLAVPLPRSALFD